MHATTTWLKFEFHAGCSCAQTKKEEEEEAGESKEKKAVQCTQYSAVQHWDIEPAENNGQNSAVYISQFKCV